MNYSAKIDLKKLKNVFLTKVKGKESEKNCIVIPIDDNYLYVGKDSVYLDLNIREISKEKRKYNNTHLITQKLPKNVYDELNEQQKNEVPILGGITPFIPEQLQNINTTSVDNIDELPF